MTFFHLNFLNFVIQKYITHLIKFHFVLLFFSPLGKEFGGQRINLQRFKVRFHMYSIVVFLVTDTYFFWRNMTYFGLAFIYINYKLPHIWSYLVYLESVSLLKFRDVDLVGKQNIWISRLFNKILYICPEGKEWDHSLDFAALA